MEPAFWPAAEAQNKGHDFIVSFVLE